MTEITAAKPRIVVLGGGFAGMGAARALKGGNADIVLVDKHDYHTFQPLLYQVATDLLETTAVGHPLRDLFDEQPNVTVHVAAATAIDVANRKVHLEAMAPLTYDYLVLALGARVNFFGVEGAREHGFPMYTLADAVRLRRHVLDRWEAVDKDPSLADDGALNVVVVGGGPTGVESAGALAELYRRVFSKDYPAVPPEQARIVLVEAGPDLFTMFKPSLRKYAANALGKLGVEVLTGEIVTSVTATRVTLKSGTVLNAHTLVWGAGLQAAPIVKTLGLELQPGDRVPVEPDLSIAGHPEVLVVGDIAWIRDSKTGEVLPQLGSVALQSGEWAGENLARRIVGEQARPFVYKDKGTMATIGRGAAVVQFHSGRTMRGRAAWLAWGTVHLALLSTGEDRAKTLVDWTWMGFHQERAGRISIDEDEAD